MKIILLLSGFILLSGCSLRTQDDLECQCKTTIVTDFKCVNRKDKIIEPLEEEIGD